MWLFHPVCVKFTLQTLDSLSNKNIDIPEVMNGNRKSDVLLDGTLLFHTNWMPLQVLTPTAQI